MKKYAVYLVRTFLKVLSIRFGAPFTEEESVTIYFEELEDTVAGRMKTNGGPLAARVPLVGQSWCNFYQYITYSPCV
jgi:hypothetical protein